jgi:hypothetical protein
MQRLNFKEQDNLNIYMQELRDRHGNMKNKLVHMNPQVADYLNVITDIIYLLEKKTNLL